VGLKLTTGPVPVPLKVTVCWLPATLPLLSVMTRVAVRLPERVGINVTLIVQLPPDATELQPELVCAKSLGSAPEIVMLLMLKAEFPVLLSVTVWAEVVVPMGVALKVRPVGEGLAVPALPVPVSDTEGVEVALSEILNAALKVPAPAGVNETLMVQVPLAGTELPQVLLAAKSPGFVPVMVILVIDKLALPELVRVTACAALVVWAP